MKLKNYTTGVSADKTIMEIEQLLAGFGASTIQKEILGDGRTESIAFKYQNKGYKLPANTEGVKMVLTEGKRVRHGVNQAKERDEQAYRTAWRIIKDWLHAQLSLIASGQTEPDQIMLPYQYDGRQTLYEAYKKNQLLITDKSQYDVNSVPREEAK